MEDLTNARDKVLRENTAQTVHKYLESVTNNRQEYGKRWIWELLQNARDAAKNHPATVHAINDRNMLTFQHDGAPFRGEEIAHLIYYGSSKHDPTAMDNVGRFGSGFLITHVLAKSITVTGLLQTTDEQPLEYFNFTLCRDGNNAHEMSRSMDESWDAFNASRTSNNDQAQFTTKYEYRLSPAAQVLVGTGLETLDTLAPYALAFNNKLRTLIVTQDGITSQTGIPADATPTLLAPSIKQTLIRTERESTTSEQHLVTAAGDNVTIAVVTETTDGRTRIKPPIDCPRLFIAFPLFGTETFCFPAIINSEQFRPQEKRDSIFLGADDTEYVRENKNLITTACGLYQELLKIASGQNWECLHHLALLPPLSTFNWLAQDWYTRLLQEHIIAPARKASIVRTTTGAHTMPAESKLPLPQPGVQTTDLWDLAAALTSINRMLPRRDDAEGWANVLQRWALVMNQRPEEFPESWTIEKLSRHVSKYETIDALQHDLGGTGAIDWLDRLYHLINAAQRAALFDELPLLPDQYGTLRLRSHLHTDEGIHDVLKDIASTLRVPARDILLDQNIDRASIPPLPQKTEDDLIGVLLTTIKTKPEDHATAPAYQHANTTLFAWLLRVGQHHKLEGYPVLARHQDEERPTIIRLSIQHADAEQIPLTPPSLWPEDAREFLDLFPERHIIATAYYDAHPNADAWEPLAKAGYVRRDPVFETSGQDSDLLPITPLPDADGQKHRVTEDVVSTRISFLNLKNTGVIDRARNSQSRARHLLHFIAEYAVRTTTFEHVTLGCECGTAHTYYRAAWLQPVASRMWVPIGEKQHAAITAETLAGLLRIDPVFLRGLALKHSPLMHSFGINGSDLLLRIGTSSEAERVELVATALDLNEALGNDPAKFQAVARALRDDPGVLNDLQEAAARRTKVRRNQAVGKTVEEILRRLLEAPEHGLTVTRKHIGHDFEIEHDLIDNTTGEPAEYGWEITNPRTRFLLEVKASTSEHYRMTPKQAETAVTEGLRFVLCMVNLPADVDITAEQVLGGARFLPTISQELGTLWREFTTLETIKEVLPTKDGGIELEIQDAQVRFKIGKERWAEGVTFDDAIAYFRTDPSEPKATSTTE